MSFTEGKWHKSHLADTKKMLVRWCEPTCVLVSAGASTSRNQPGAALWSCEACHGNTTKVPCGNATFWPTSSTRFICALYVPALNWFRAISNLTGKTLDRFLANCI
jgi:hypothetical protein